ncbi:hypothetical protein FYJ74_10515 [Pyramidobacter sp. SM-530-WT-4B]|uniref:Uncharacterized protein n=1 Tax=Pyramidobacter porci TaxID=2605789 RepID=A0A6L5YEK2_9BACT|nr:hypothetical protein [Pyramidobacter porci]MST56458.1 hypothetical protein [Pyramidobacter porci]
MTDSIRNSLKRDDRSDLNPSEKHRPFGHDQAFVPRGESGAQGVDVTALASASRTFRRRKTSVPPRPWRHEENRKMRILIFDEKASLKMPELQGAISCSFRRAVGAIKGPEKLRPSYRKFILKNSFIFHGRDVRESRKRERPQFF